MPVSQAIHADRTLYVVSENLVAIVAYWPKCEVSPRPTFRSVSEKGRRGADLRPRRSLRRRHFVINLFASHGGEFYSTI